MTKPELFFIGLIEESDKPILCPICSEGDQDEEQKTGSSNVLEGPFTRYKKREEELYFDLEAKYLTCTNCGGEIRVIDFQVLVEEISAKLPPEEARAFSTKIMNLYDGSRDYAIEVLSILTGDIHSESKTKGGYLEELEQLTQSRSK